ncbi:hypothetical protein GH714_009611 [Hevea brasiliensis]|uniref:Sieve element occlusion C-terminal domain-containing protein n=1 Tax=Hevea brasiliensis TaxID=3981 RepID=A0A6A6M7Q5_HEVBR|nr:hypothetical protein GH714_009611 [Hevea brasiliensis]
MLICSIVLWIGDDKSSFWIGLISVTVTSYFMKTTAADLWACQKRSHPVWKLTKGDRLMFSSSDDNAMTKQIEATHSPDGREFDAKPLLQLVEDYLIEPPQLLMPLPCRKIAILEQIYNESRLHPTKQESQYEIVWLPILDPNILRNDNMQKKFENLQAGMTWYSIYHPSLIDRAVIKFIKEEWHFGKKPILVITEGRYICLYGGEDMDWIRKFTNTARAVALAAGIPLGMVYAGKSNPKDRVRKNIEAIIVEKLSHYWQDLTSVWYFWVRIESMWRSKNQLGKTAENDPIMKEIMTMLSFDSSQGGWAIFTRGSDEMVKAKGAPFLTCLTNYSTWQDQIQQKGFMPTLRDQLKDLHTEHHCNRLVLPGAAGLIPERIVCSECGRVMEIIMYQCCDE